MLTKSTVAVLSVMLIFELTSAAKIIPFGKIRAYSYIEMGREVNFIEEIGRAHV